MKDDELFYFKDDFDDLDEFKDDFEDYKDDFDDFDEFKDDFDDSFLNESDDFDFEESERAFDFFDEEVAVALPEQKEPETPPIETEQSVPEQLILQKKEETFGHGAAQSLSVKFKNERVSEKNILRDAVQEHTFGIEDLKLYCISEGEGGRVAIYGQIIASRILSSLRVKLVMKPKEEGGLLGSEAPSGVTLRSEAVVPYFFYNRYPFQFRLPYTAEEFGRVDALLSVERDESTLKEPTTANFSNLKITLAGSAKSAPVTLGKMKQDEKFPQDRVTVFREAGLGFTDFSFTLQKTENGMFRATDICSGNVGQAVRVTAMYFNVAGDLIHLEQDLEHAGKKDYELHKHELTLPYEETLARVVVYVSPTPAAIEEKMRQKVAGRLGTERAGEVFADAKENSKHKKLKLFSVLAFIFGPLLLILGIILENSTQEGSFFIFLGIVLLISAFIVQQANKKNEKK